MKDPLGHNQFLPNKTDYALAFLLLLVFVVIILFISSPYVSSRNQSERVRIAEYCSEDKTSCFEMTTLVTKEEDYCRETYLVDGKEFFLVSGSCSFELRNKR